MSTPEIAAMIRADCARSDAESEARFELLLGVQVVDETLCQARLLTPKGDTRFKPAVHGERQCSRKPVAGDDLCAKCRKNLENYATTDTPAGMRWHNRVSETITDHSHTLTSEWAETAKPKWVGP